MGEAEKTQFDRAMSELSDAIENVRRVSAKFPQAAHARFIELLHEHGANDAGAEALDKRGAETTAAADTRAARDGEPVKRDQPE